MVILWCQRFLVVIQETLVHSFSPKLHSNLNSCVDFFLWSTQDRFPPALFLGDNGSRTNRSTSNRPTRLQATVNNSVKTSDPLCPEKTAWLIWLGSVEICSTLVSCQHGLRWGPKDVMFCIFLHKKKWLAASFWLTLPVRIDNTSEWNLYQS